MLNCPNCESRVHPTWDYCPRCHSDLTGQDALADEATIDDPTFEHTAIADLEDEADFEPLSEPVLIDDDAAIASTDASEDDGDAEAATGDDTEPDDLEIVAVARSRLSPAAHAAAWSPGLGKRAPRRWEGATMFVRRDGRIERMREARVPAWSLAVALGVFLLALAVTPGMGRGGDDGDALAAAQQAQRTAGDEVMRLTAALDTAEATEADLREQLSDTTDELSTLRGDAAGSQTAFNALQAQVDSLREDLDEAQEGIDERDVTLESYESQIASLVECLSGMEIALEFGRQGLWDPADRALQAVSAACSATRGL